MECGGHPLQKRARPQLLDLIEVEEGTLSAARVLLGHVLVVDDLDTALQEVRSRFRTSADDGRLYTFVTRKGEFVSGSGVICGGKEGKSGGSSGALMARRREMDELAARHRSP